MASKTADAIKLVLRLPKPLHKRLTQQARRENVSLNTLIVNQLSNPKPAILGNPVILPPEAIPNIIDPRIAASFRKEIEKGIVPIVQQEFALGIAPILRKEIETLVRDVRVAQAESEKRSQDMPAVPEREKGEERK